MAKTPAPPTPAPTASPRPSCSSCGRPLTRLPSYLASSLASGAAVQCERCFFPETSRGRNGAGVVSSESTRWLSGLADDSSGRELILPDVEEE